MAFTPFRYSGAAVELNTWQGSMCNGIDSLVYRAQSLDL